MSFPKRFFEMEDKFGYELSRLLRMCTYVVKFIIAHHEFRMKNALKFHVHRFLKSKLAFQLKTKALNNNILPVYTQNCGLIIDGTLYPSCKTVVVCSFQSCTYIIILSYKIIIYHVNNIYVLTNNIVYLFQHMLILDGGVAAKYLW